LFNRPSSDAFLKWCLL